MPFELAADNGGYTIVSIATQRANASRAILVHIARDATAVPRIIGLWRE